MKYKQADQYLAGLAPFSKGRVIARLSNVEVSQFGSKVRDVALKRCTEAFSSKFQNPFSMATV